MGNDLKLRTELANRFPHLFGIGDFRPSLLQCLTIIAWMSTEEDLRPQNIVTKLGHDIHNWYVWQKQPGFNDWWNECCTQSFRSSDLMSLYKAFFRRAMVSDTAAGKIFIQRFDPLYTERSQSDSRHTFAGYLPGSDEDVGDAVQRSRDRVAALTEGKGKAPDNTPDDDGNGVDAMGAPSGAEHDGFTPDSDSAEHEQPSTTNTPAPPGDDAGSAVDGDSSAADNTDDTQAHARKITQEQSSDNSIPPGGVDGGAGTV